MASRHSQTSANASGTRKYNPKIVSKLMFASDRPLPRQMGPVKSEVLTLGFPDANGEVVLVGVDRDLPLGGRLF